MRRHGRDVDFMRGVGGVEGTVDRCTPVCIAVEMHLTVRVIVAVRRAVG